MNSLDISLQSLFVYLVLIIPKVMKCFYVIVFRPESEMHYSAISGYDKINIEWNDSEIKFYL